MYILEFLMASHRSLRLLIFLYFFFLFLKLSLPLRRFTDSFICSCLLLSPSNEIFICYCTFQLHNSYLVLFISNFYLFIDILYSMRHYILFLWCFNMVYFSALNIFQITNLKSLSSKSSILAPSGTVSVDCFFFLNCIWTMLSFLFTCLIISRCNWML